MSRPRCRWRAQARCRPPCSRLGRGPTLDQYTGVRLLPLCLHRLLQRLLQGLPPVIPLGLLHRSDAGTCADAGAGRRRARRHGVATVVAYNGR